MTLITGTPLGVITAQDKIYVDSAPYIYFQDYAANELNNPDGDGFYWGLTGSSTYPVYSLECYEEVRWASDFESNAIRCDTTGDGGQIQKLNHIDLTFTLKTFFDLATLKHILRGGPVTTAAGATEKMGIGQPNNNQYYHYYFVNVYDESTGDYLAVTCHKAQFVDAWEIAYTYGQPATINVVLRAFADTTKPAAQLFATILRADPSAI